MIVSIASGKGGTGKTIVEYALESDVAREIEKAWEKILSALRCGSD